MLVLSRKKDESLIIGEEIIVTVVDIRGDKVRIGVECSKDIPIHRKEVWEAIERERRIEKRKSERENPSD